MRSGHPSDDLKSHAPKMAPPLPFSRPIRRRGVTRMSEVDEKRSRATCLFCDQRSGSAEHAFPVWLQRHMNPTGDDAKIDLDGRHFETGKYSFFRTKLVCHDCNTKWMNDTFEATAKPLIIDLCTRPDPRTITTRQQRLLARWVYKTALTLEACREGGPMVDRKVYRRFRSSAEPTAHTTLVMGRSAHHTLAHLRRLFPTPGATPSGGVGKLRMFDPDAPGVGYAFTMVIDRLWFYGVVGGLDMVPRDDSVASAPEQVHFIWPPTSSGVPWPMEKPFSKTALEQVANTFGDDEGFVLYE